MPLASASMPLSAAQARAEAIGYLALAYTGYAFVFNLGYDRAFPIAPE